MTCKENINLNKFFEKHERFLQYTLEPAFEEDRSKQPTPRKSLFFPKAYTLFVAGLFLSTIAFISPLVAMDDMDVDTYSPATTISRDEGERAASRTLVRVTDTLKEHKDHNLNVADDPSNILSLNSEIIALIFDALEPRDYCSARETCQRFNEICSLMPLNLTLTPDYNVAAILPRLSSLPCLRSLNLHDIEIGVDVTNLSGLANNPYIKRLTCTGSTYICPEELAPLTTLPNLIYVYLGDGMRDSSIMNNRTRPVVAIADYFAYEEETEAAATYYENGLSFRDSDGNKVIKEKERAEVLCKLGALHHEEDPNDAVNYYRDALALVDINGDSILKGKDRVEALKAKAKAHRDLFEPGPAIECYNEALAVKNRFNQTALSAKEVSQILQAKEEASKDLFQ